MVPCWKLPRHPGLVPRVAAVLRRRRCVDFHCRNTRNKNTRNSYWNSLSLVEVGNMANTETFDFQKFHKDTECFEQDSKCLEGPVPTTLRQAASTLTTNLGLDNFGMTNNNRGTPSYHPLIGFSITNQPSCDKGVPPWLCKPPYKSSKSCGIG